MRVGCGEPACAPGSGWQPRGARGGVHGVTKGRAAGPWAAHRADLTASHESLN